MANTYPFAQRVVFGARRSGVEPDAATYQPGNRARSGSHELCSVMHSNVLRIQVKAGPSSTIGKRVQIFSYYSCSRQSLGYETCPNQAEIIPWCQAIVPDLFTLKPISDIFNLMDTLRN